MRHQARSPTHYGQQGAEAGLVSPPIKGDARHMIDNLVLLMTHGLLLLTAVRLMRNPALDEENAPPATADKPRKRRWGRSDA
ncbi:hypothetical protein [Sphingomonas sp. LT1P40]|uniref:hypothetical protein n=1 Tax=Alteristakelama amylovorans TaxID=3096166 RepID=UPI002FCA2E34